MQERQKIPGWHAPLRSIRPSHLFAAYALLCLAPLAIAALDDVPPGAFHRELASGLAMVAFAMMIAQFLLSGRFGMVTGRTGIDRIMRFHQLATYTIVAFIVAHPLLYVAPQFLTTPGEGWRSLGVMLGSGALATGVVGLGLVLLVAVLAILRDRLPLRYEAWRLGHGVGAGAIALLGLDHTLRVGTYSAAPALVALWSALVAVAMLTLVQVYLIKPLTRRARPYRVVANTRVAHRMWEITIEPDGPHGAVFAPGQFAWLNLGHSPFSLTEHPFSISSAPGTLPRLAFTIKEDGDFTDGIGRIAPGARAYLDGPHGCFTLIGRRPAGIGLIAGGVGMAPIMSILRQLRDEGFAGPLRLVYGNRIETQILYRDEIEAMGRTLDLTVHHVLSEPPPGWTGPVGMLDEAALRACLGPAEAGWIYFVCGPAVVIDNTERTLQAMGVAATHIVSERFRYD